jgi:hypothetical protein
MCVNAAGKVVEKALEAARAQWDLVATINAEAKVHGGVVVGARALLVKRGDSLALDLFDSVTLQPDLEKARALVESAGQCVGHRVSPKIHTLVGMVTAADLWENEKTEGNAQLLIGAARALVESAGATHKEEGG